MVIITNTFGMVGYIILLSVELNGKLDLFVT